MGRPRIPVDTNLVEGLALIGCTDKEIATLSGCSVDTLTRRFADILSKGREGLKVKLRRAQIRAAEGGNVVMLIWLGKQYLAQTDRIAAEVNHAGSITSYQVDIGGAREITTADIDSQHIN